MRWTAEGLRPTWREPRVATILAGPREGGGAGGGPAAHVAGGAVRYDPRRPAGRRIRSVEVGRGRKLQANAEYTLAVDDFLASGGDGYALLAGLPFEPGTMLAGEGGV